MKKNQSCQNTKSLILFAAIVVTSLLSSAVARSQGEIETLLKRYCTAVEKGDTTTLNAIFSDDMIVTSTGGATRNRAEEISDLVFPGVNIHHFKTDDVRIRTYSGAAVATGRLFWKMDFQGKESEVERRFTFTIVRIDGHWKIVSQHIGRVPDRK